MTEAEREELIEKMAERINEMRLFLSTNTETARAALEVAEPVIREQCARIADEEANAMAEQRDEIIENGTLGARNVPDKFKRSFAYERKILIDGYEQIAAAIREGGKS